MTNLSIIIPNLNDGIFLDRLLSQLNRFRPKTGWEVIVVDGGSSDNSTEIAQRADLLVECKPGRSNQFCAGIAKSQGDLLWFLHADSQVSFEVCEAITQCCFDSHSAWGRFDVDFKPRSRMLSLVAYFMNQRSCITGICTGDQGMFVTRESLEAVGGFPDQVLMEDIELSRRLKRLSPPECRKERLCTSARRWQKKGLVNTILLMWVLRLAYFFGVDPKRLAATYYGSIR